MELKRLCAYMCFVRFLLLIVPYGIETSLSFSYQLGHETFNRTLWN